MTEDYPTYCARGVTDSDCISDGQMKHCVFQFVENKGNQLYELSIQWLDNDESEKIAKEMMKRNMDEPKFISGFAVILKDTLDDIKTTYSVMDYCRVPNRSENAWNPYHGHITVPNSIGRIERRQLAAELAHRSEYYRYDMRLPVDNLPIRD